MSEVSEHIEPALTPGDRVERVIKGFARLRSDLAIAFQDRSNIPGVEAVEKKLRNAEETSLRVVTQHRV